jgi:AcrR family transcriptional regulator
MLSVQPGAAEERRSFIEAARRAQIVRAAVETIAAEGYAKASFVRIAARAGISPGLITYHFKAKDQLIRAVVEHVDANLDAAMSEGPEPATYAEALERILTGYVRHCAQRPNEMTALHQILAGASSASLRHLAEERDRAGTAELVEFLTEAQRNGEFRPFDAGVFAAAMLSVMQSVPARLRERPDVDPERYGREVTELFVHAAIPSR